ncbi:hypothetical protein K474DRAFT_1683625 [Panus rudis PR-1116 ss-1]|nr:hypothetical protein K474DRAFT_1683625 [Panus rudis PR-1116 ss-1]
MPADKLTIHPAIFRRKCLPLNASVVQARELRQADLDVLLSCNIGDNTLGVAALYGSQCRMVAIALASLDKVLVIRLPSTKDCGKGRSIQKADLSLLQQLTCNREIRLLSFDMDRISTALFLDHGVLINEAVDIQSLSPHKAPRDSNERLFATLGGEDSLYKEKVLKVFKESTAVDDLAVRAWASYIVSTLPTFLTDRKAVKPIATDDIEANDMKRKQLLALAKCIRVADRLHALKPTKVKNDVGKDLIGGKGGMVNLDLTRFKTRIRESANQRIIVHYDHHGAKQASGRATNVRGKNAKVSLGQNIPTTATVKAVYTYGKDDPTHAERERTQVILECLQRTNSLLSYSFARAILLDVAMSNSGAMTVNCVPRIHFPNQRPLNASQRRAVLQIVSESPSDRICIVHGPPGTGKTTVIAASVHTLVNNPTHSKMTNIWLLAQSNVAVKNIAEKLAKTSFFSFKLLVSKDFHFQWHEHLYHRIEENMIRSDDFNPHKIDMRTLLDGCHVILCTLSMLSHPRLMEAGFTRFIPVETVIVDEASQIEVGDYIPMLNKFRNSIRKLVFIGDDKQYRMPHYIGAFISTHVYSKRLKTEHSIEGRLSCRFVNIAQGRETNFGNSWMNEAEVQAIVHIARRYHSSGESYRIITPYDAQRNALEKALKAAKLAWEDKCFNVDSFQGNEDDHILISVVRSEKVGFLRNMRRSNSMVIFTSRAFIADKAKDTLLGKLAREWTRSNEPWTNWQDIVSGRF